MKSQELFAIRYRRRVFDENFDERARRRFHDDKHGYRKPDAITKRKFQRCFHFVVLFRAVVVCDERRSPLCKSRYHTERHGVDFFRDADCRLRSLAVSDHKRVQHKIRHSRQHRLKRGRKPRKQYVPCDFFLDRKTRLFRRKRHDGFFPYHDKQYRKIQRGNDV